MAHRRWLVPALAILGLSTLPEAANAACSSIDTGKCAIELKTGIRMAYVETGPSDGKAVILLHGLTDTARSWSATMASLHRLDPSLHILAVDQRGHGSTSMPAGAQCPKDPKTCFAPKLFADDLAAFMESLKIPKATIAGHSMGSIVSQEMALDYPDKVERVILVATSNKTKDNSVVRDYVLNEPVLGSWKKALDAKGITSPEAVWNATPRDADPNAEEWIAKNWDVDLVADPALVKAIVPETSNVKMGTWIGATSALLDFDNTARLASLKTPILVLWGSQDSIFYHEPDQIGIIDVLRKAASTNGIVAIWKQYGVDPLPASGAQETDIGHNVQWDAPDQVATDILSFIKTGRPTPDLTRAVITSAGTTIKTEPGKATIITLP